MLCNLLRSHILIFLDGVSIFRQQGQFSIQNHVLKLVKIHVLVNTLLLLSLLSIWLLHLVNFNWRLIFEWPLLRIRQLMVDIPHQIDKIRRHFRPFPLLANGW